MRKKILLVFSLLSLAFVFVAKSDDSLLKNFQRPPDSARPWVYWFWLNGNLTREGITADLEAMKRVGIGGVLIMEVDQGTPKGPAGFGRPEWRELFKHVLSEANRLGLEVNMNNDAGWCGSGGPWITPDLAMQKLVWTETFVEGPKHIEQKLAQPQAVANFYRDITVLAFPSPSGDDVKMADRKPKITSSMAEGFDGNKIIDGDASTFITLPKPATGKTPFIQLEFEKPFAARTLLLTLGGSSRRSCRVELQASDDGKKFRKIGEFDARPPMPALNFPEVSARFFKLTFTKADKKLSKIEVAEVELNPRYRIENIQAKSALIPQEIPLRSSFPVIPAELTVRKDGVVDLTPHLGKDNQLTWDVPKGRWTILRIGHTPTGKDNHPAPEPGRGLECDKLSKAGTDAMFSGLMQKLIDDSKPLVGKALVATHIDSWEVGSQNWTKNFRQEFQRLRGYDPLPFLPVMTGRVMDSVEVSERFLWDMRKTVSDLLVENYAGRFRELAQKNGLRLSIEGYDGTPCDDMTYTGQADEPMAEFWSVGYNTAYSCLEMSSAAHVYGKRILGAEAFTATDAEKWQLHPAAIKTLGDWAFCNGINRFVFHRYAMQPWLDVKPGMSMGPWGLHYERTQAWWEQSKPWHEYLARCQFMLRQGLFVADVCFLEPENSPLRFHPPHALTQGNTPERPAYNYDGCTPEVVLTRMKVEDGRLVLPDGMSYRVLVLPRTGTMTPKLLGKIKELIADGATVIGPRPLKSPSLSDFPACDKELKKLTAEIWGSGKAPSQVTERNFGKGKIIFGGPIESEETSMPGETSPLLGAKWIWHNEGNPAVAVPPGKRYFRRVFHLENTAIASARLAMTADNSFTCWINGEQVGEGYDFNHSYTFDVSRVLRPGENVIAVRAENGATEPNPAGLIATLKIHPRNGADIELSTDASWQSAKAVEKDWMTSAQSTGSWNAALDLGPLGVGPWTATDKSQPIPDVFPAFGTIAGVLEKTGLSSDFESDQPLRYIHRRDGDTDIYFVANPENEPRAANCTFRVAGKTPEIWDPIDGSSTEQVIRREENGRTTLPLWLEPAGSRFVVFRKTGSKPAVLVVTRNRKDILPDANSAAAEPQIEFVRDNAGNVNARVWSCAQYEVRTSPSKTRQFDVDALPWPEEVKGSWEVQFEPNRGAPEHATFDKLISWSEHAEAGVKYFSGAAIYQKNFYISQNFLRKNQRLFLDLGKVQVIAEVKLNGKEVGTAWKPPFRVDITDAAKVGDNALEVKVVNLWINRMIGDELLPEDSARNSNGTLKEWPKWLDNKTSPTGRHTFTSWKLWAKDAPLQQSGLLGQVRLVPCEMVEIGP